jgi:hypothetical protein
MKTDGPQLHKALSKRGKGVGSSTSHAFLKSFFPRAAFCTLHSVKINYSSALSFSPKKDSLSARTIFHPSIQFGASLIHQKSLKEWLSSSNNSNYITDGLCLSVCRANKSL